MKENRLIIVLVLIFLCIGFSSCASTKMIDASFQVPMSWQYSEKQEPRDVAFTTNIGGQLKYASYANFVGIGANFNFSFPMSGETTYANGNKVKFNRGAYSEFWQLGGLLGPSFAYLGDVLIVEFTPGLFLGGCGYTGTDGIKQSDFFLGPGGMLNFDIMMGETMYFKLGVEFDYVLLSMHNANRGSLFSGGNISNVLNITQNISTKNVTGPIVTPSVGFGFKF